MEYQSSASLLLLIPLLLLLLLRLSKPKNRAKIQIPGPRKLPVLGNLHQLAAASSSLQHHALHELSLKHGPLMQLQLGELSTVIVSSPDMAKEIMKTHDIAFAQRPCTSSAKIVSYGSADIAFAPYGNYWRQMRKISTLKLLSSQKVQSFSHVRQDEVSKLIESVQSSIGSVFDLTSKIYYLTSSIVLRVVIGDNPKDGVELVQLLHAVSKHLGEFHFADLFPSNKLIRLMTGTEARLGKIHEKVDKVLEDILQENLRKLMKSEGGDDCNLAEENLLQVLLRIQRSESLDVPLTTTNLKAVIWDMFGGGTDTSASLLEWAMSEMMRNPRVMEKAQNEVRNAFKGKKVIDDNSEMSQLSYLKSVIKETLRLHPPVPLLLPRECRETCEIKGYEIPIQTQVIINAWALGRDPNYWYDAESFIPERFQSGKSDIDFKGTNFEFIPFGAGRRMCPGILFGLASVELPLASLLYHFDWELPNGMEPKDLDMTETVGVAARRKSNLCLIPTPYKNCYSS